MNDQVLDSFFFSFSFLFLSGYEKRITDDVGVLMRMALVERRVRGLHYGVMVSLFGEIPCSRFTHMID